jgi:hypothetical protein
MLQHGPQRPPASMTGLELGLATAENYTRFAEHEAAGRSPQYEMLAYAVAEDRSVLSFLDLLVPPKRQPNLLFAAAHYLLGTPPDIASLRSLVSARPGELAQVMATRRTQTNEAARCAVLLPALLDLRPPLASFGNARPNDFLLVRDGAEVLARADPHGTWLDWLG